MLSVACQHRIIGCLINRLKPSGNYMNRINCINNQQLCILHSGSCTAVDNISHDVRSRDLRAVELVYRTWSKKMSDKCRPAVSLLRYTSPSWNGHSILYLAWTRRSCCGFYGVTKHRARARSGPAEGFLMCGVWQATGGSTCSLNESLIYVIARRTVLKCREVVKLLRPVFLI